MAWRWGRHAGSVQQDHRDQDRHLRRLLSDTRSGVESAAGVSLLSDDQLRHFFESAYLVVPDGVAPGDVCALNVEVDRLIAAAPPPVGQVGHHSYRQDPADSPGLFDVLERPRGILELARDLTGNEGIDLAFRASTGRAEHPALRPPSRLSGRRAPRAEANPRTRRRRSPRALPTRTQHRRQLREQPHTPRALLAVPRSWPCGSVEGVPCRSVARAPESQACARRCELAAPDSLYSGHAELLVPRLSR